MEWSFYSQPDELVIPTIDEMLDGKYKYVIDMDLEMKHLKDPSKTIKVKYSGETVSGVA